MQQQQHSHSKTIWQATLPVLSVNHSLDKFNLNLEQMQRYPGIKEYRQKETYNHQTHNAAKLFCQIWFDKDKMSSCFKRGKNLKIPLKNSKRTIFLLSSKTRK